MYFKNLLAPTDIGQGHHNLAIEAARTQQGRIEHVGTVGGSHHQHALAGFKTVHFDQQLIQGLFAFIVTAAQTCATLTRSEERRVGKEWVRTWRSRWSPYH